MVDMSRYVYDHEAKEYIDIAPTPLSEERLSLQTWYGKIIANTLRQTPQHEATIVYRDNMKTYGCGCSRHTGKIVRVFTSKQTDSLIVEQTTTCGIVLTYCWAIESLQVIPTA